MNWFKNLFATKASYPKQALDTKIIEILDTLDTFLCDHATTMPTDAVMVIKPYKIGLFSQHLPMSVLCKSLLNMLPTEGYAYLPRSIAFVTEADGTWCFRIAFREQGECDLDKCEMFVELLSRTNDARSN